MYKNSRQIRQIRAIDLVKLEKLIADSDSDAMPANCVCTLTDDWTQAVGCGDKCFQCGVKHQRKSRSRGRGRQQADLARNITVQRTEGLRDARVEMTHMAQIAKGSLSGEAT